ncbi:hypothetical protein JZU46_05325 [bacterium]|nr:hypothetical protein [bacterium]
MAELFVQHTLNPHKVAKFIVNLRSYVLRGEDDTGYKWVLEIGTTSLKADGTNIKPSYVHNVTEATIEKEIEKAISYMCSLMDWSDFDEDRYPPYFTYFYPKGNNVPSKTVVTFNVAEDAPSSGVDLSGMVVTLNNGDVDFDITSEILVTGDPYDYTLSWIPPNFNG